MDLHRRRYACGQCDAWRHGAMNLVIYACFVPYLGICRLSGCDICRRCGMSSTPLRSRSVRAVHLRLFGDGLAVSVLLALSAARSLRCMAARAKWRISQYLGNMSCFRVCGGQALVVVAARVWRFSQTWRRATRRLCFPMEKGKRLRLQRVGVRCVCRVMLCNALGYSDEMLKSASNVKKLLIVNTWLYHVI